MLKKKAKSNLMAPTKKGYVANMWNALYAEKYRLKFLQNLLEVKRDHTKYFKFLLKKGYVANMWNALYTEKYSFEFLQKIQSQIFAKFARNKKG